MNTLQAFNESQRQKLLQSRVGTFDDFRPGDTVCVHVKIKEGERERIQRFEGVCIAMRKANVHTAFRLRRVSGEFAMERVFALYSPLIQSIQCLRRGKVRRAKLYYLRYRSRKQARIEERSSKHS